jgi:hypothetical protein
MLVALFTFLTDVLNLELLRKHKHTAEMISSVTAFTSILTLWKTDIKRKTPLHFPHLKNMSEAGSEENF